MVSNIFLIIIAIVIIVKVSLLTTLLHPISLSQAEHGFVGAFIVVLLACCHHRRFVIVAVGLLLMITSLVLFECLYRGLYNGPV